MDHDSWAGVTETHTGTVFFLGDIAMKVRKPVRYSFVDYTSRAQRRRACLEEVRLNRRLSPDVYLGVGSIVVPGADPEPAVMMRRLPERARLSALVTSHAPRLDAALDLVARRLAAFHQGCPPQADVGRPAQLAQLWDDATQTLLRHPAVVDAGRVAAAGTLARDYLAGRRDLLDRRVDDNWVRDGHGDLLADDIFVLDDGPRILDCLDFDERLRCGDVLLDVAFLAMDLERLGAPALARLFLDRYCGYAGEKHPPSLEHFYIAYRAMVRAKVLALRVDQGATDAGPDLRRCVGLAIEHLRAATAVVVLVGGLPGAGKTTVARRLAEAAGWVRLSTDELRRHEGAPSGYDESSRAAVYDDLLRCARDALADGSSVVLDGTWSADEWRRRARAMADDAQATIVEICCDVDDEFARARLGGRRGDASDADADVRALLAAAFDPWPQAAVVDGSDTGRSAQTVRSLVDAAVRWSCEPAQPATVTNE